MNTYIFLGGAIVAEVIGTTFMKYSEGFTRLWPSVGGVSGNPRKFRHSALWNFLGGWSAA